METPRAWREDRFGDVLDGALQDEQGQSPLGSVVVFTDGRNNSGKPVLEVAKGYRVRGVPVNVVGVGQLKERGDLAIRFSDRKPNAVAKEDLLLKCEATNQFDQSVELGAVVLGGKTFAGDSLEAEVRRDSLDLLFSPQAEVRRSTALPC